MDEKAYKRLVRLLVISWVLIVILILIITSLGSYQISQVRNIALQNEPKIVVGPKGDTVVGPSGYTPVKNVDYFDGKDGKNATDEQVQKAVDRYMAAHPVKNGKDGKDGKTVVGPQGDTGAAGVPGRIVFIRYEEGQFECRYNGDSDWQPIEECQ